jgi:DNA-binding response OmpR family regulator
MRQRRVLVVEDDHDLRRLFRVALSMEGYEVEEAADGIDALRLIDNAPPDIVVLDLQLLVLDGASVQQELAARAITRDIPIVVVTGSDQPLSGPNVACLLRKPVSPDRLIRTVRTCLLRGSGSPV